MKISSSFLALAATLVLSVNAAPYKRDVPPNLVPNPEHPRGLNPTGTGDCDGIAGPNGQPIKIPCACPPSVDELREALNLNYNAGRVVNNPDVALPPFPTGNTPEDEIQRISAATIILQNLRGPGQGCPLVSTTFKAQQDRLRGQPAPAPAPAPPPPANAAPPPPPPPANNGGGSVRSLAPQFGIDAGVNPTGTGDCDGVIGPNGQPVKIPCSCPPDREEFLRQLEANVAAGRAVNNPGVQVSFPLGGSPQDESGRITATLITLQNLRGPGQGCPAASTNLLARQRELGA